MTSAVHICNRALSWIGADQITSLGDDSPEARQCSLHYEAERDNLLGLADWTFAEARQTLALLTNDRDEEWDYRYRRPIDCIRILWVNDPEIALLNKRAGKPLSDRYDLAGTSIYSDIEDAVCEYIREVEDPTLFPTLFQTALSWAVAKSVVVPLTQDSRRVEFCEKRAEVAMSIAIAHDTREEVHTDEQVPDWYRDRLDTET